MTDAREKIKQKILADIRKRVDTYWSEIQMNDAGFSDTAKAAKEELHKWAARDLKFLLEEYDEYGRFANRVSSLPTCNDCGETKDCPFKPQWGDSVRYNCHLWKHQHQ